MLSITVREIVAGLGPAPAGDEAALDLDSLGVVMLVEALEDRLGVRIGPRDVVPENLGSVANICAFLARRGVCEAGPA
ncbi:MAG: acyl carrier protein [Candidatus Sericytochromatia bacterium]|nr:acyl carrier protein [Candidatus Tanganyikabacteria bacterium]